MALDIQLRDPGSDFDIALQSAAGGITGTVATAQAAQALSSAGLLAFAGSAGGAQAVQSATAVGVLLFTGAEAAGQPVQTCSSTGTVSAGAVTGTATTAQAGQTVAAAGAVAGGAGIATGGRGRRRRRIIWERVTPWISPEPITGDGRLEQAPQYARAFGLRQQVVAGASAPAQRKQTAYARAKHDTKRRDERDLQEIIVLLDAA